MALRKLSLVFAAVALSSTVFAANLKTSNITIPGGTIAPRGSITLSTDNLVPDTSYTVVCKIKHANHAKNDTAAIKVETWGYTTLNGADFFYQTNLTQEDNELRVSYASNYSPIVITNLDNDDKIEVSNCVAKPDAFAW